MTIEKTIESRKNTHGSWQLGAKVAQDLKRTIKSHMTESGPHTDSVMEGIDRICMKLSRIAVGDATEPDHWHDIAGYATLVENDIKQSYSQSQVMSTTRCTK